MVDRWRALLDHIEKPEFFAMHYSFIRRFGVAGVVALFFALAGALDGSAQGGAAPEIVPRSAWAAKPANKALMKAQAPREIVIHHTAERQQPKQPLAQKLRRLQKFSQTTGSVEGRPKPAWGDVPYHFYIDAEGRVGQGRNLNYAGDTNTGYSTANRIQIVLEGHFDREQPTPSQLQSLDRLVFWLAGKYRVPAAKISGHNDHVPTSDCPGHSLKSYLPRLRDKVAKAASAR